MSASQISLNLISTRARPWKSSGFDSKKMGTYGHKNHPKTAHISGCLTRFSTENPWSGHKSTQGGIGVENLQGSGLIAGETSRAYQARL